MEITERDQQDIIYEELIKQISDEINQHIIVLQYKPHSTYFVLQLAEY